MQLCKANRHFLLAFFSDRPSHFGTLGFRFFKVRWVLRGLGSLGFSYGYWVVCVVGMVLPRFKGSPTTIGCVPVLTLCSFCGRSCQSWCLRVVVGGLLGVLWWCWVIVYRVHSYPFFLRLKRFRWCLPFNFKVSSRREGR